MRVLVCGGRNFNDWGLLFRTLVEITNATPITALIHGGASGADAMAHRWAGLIAKPVEVYPALWRQHGRSAGPIRNQKMIDEGKPDLVVAFPCGKGTADMIRRAEEAGIPTLLKNEA